MITTNMTEQHYLLCVRMAETRHPTDGKIMVKENDLFWLAMDYHYGVAQLLGTKTLAYKFETATKALNHLKECYGKPWYCKPKIETAQILQVTRNIEVVEKFIDIRDITQ